MQKYIKSPPPYRIHTWPNIESNEITVPFREEEIKKFSIMRQLHFLPPFLSFHFCLHSKRSVVFIVSMNTSIETRRNIVVRSIDRDIAAFEFLSNEPWPIVEFLSFSPAFSFFPPLLFYRVSRRVRLHVQSSNINFKVGWDRVTRNRVNNRVKM